MTLEGEMTERSYTVAEMDRMRRAIEHQWLFGRKISEPDPYASSGVDKDGNSWMSTTGHSRAHTEEQKTACVEELLRTYILAGTEPQELE